MLISLTLITISVWSRIVMYNLTRAAIRKINAASYKISFRQNMLRTIWVEYQNFQKNPIRISKTIITPPYKTLDMFNQMFSVLLSFRSFKYSKLIAKKKYCWANIQCANSKVKKKSPYDPSTHAQVLSSLTFLGLPTNLS